MTFNPLNDPAIRNALRSFLATGYCMFGNLDRQLEREEKKIGNASRIIRYQRIAPFDSLPFAPYMTSVVRPETLREHFKYLKKNAEVVPLQQLLIHWNNPQALPKRSVALTFDGGWAEHYSTVIPLLNEFGMVATFLIPTAFIGTNNSLWHDKIQIVLLSMAKAQLPFPRLEVLPDEINQQFLEPDDRITSLKIVALLTILSQAPKPDLAFALQELGIAVSDVPLIETPRSFLRWEELRSMAKGNHSIAPLGHTHRRFSDIAREEVAGEAHLAFQTIIQNGITPTPIIAAPDGDLPNEAMETLVAIGCSICLTLGRERAEGSLETSLAVQRVPIFQESASSQELFACRVWGARILNQLIV